MKTEYRNILYQAIEICDGWSWYFQNGSWEAGDAFWEAGEAGINMRQGAKQVSLGAELSVLQTTSMFCCRKKATV